VYAIIYLHIWNGKKEFFGVGKKIYHKFLNFFQKSRVLFLNLLFKILRLDKVHFDIKSKPGYLYFVFFFVLFFPRNFHFNRSNQFDLNDGGKFEKKTSLFNFSIWSDKFDVIV
jgi:hypothetical protein